MSWIYKLYSDGVRGTTWCLLDNMYSEIKEEVRWKGHFSRSFGVFKGVRQGGVMSTALYKLFINQLLLGLEKSGLGLHIGTIYIGSPTCADDQLLLANTSTDMQAMITACHSYAEDHQYTLHPEKSTVTAFFPKHRDKDELNWMMGDNQMPRVSSFTHLGLDWCEEKTSPNIEGRIQLARKTVYALMGTGLHGNNGLSPATSLHIIKIYVIPRLLYGLDAAVLTKRQREELNNYYRNLLRIIQGLPKATASEAIYLLMGEVPIEAELDIRILSLFGAVCRADTNSTLKKLATRQMALDNRHSWFAQIRQLCQKYKISTYLSIEAPWRKKTWNDHVGNAVKGYWIQRLLEGATDKPSLRLVNPANVNVLAVHAIWTSCAKMPRLVPAAVLRAKMITNTYWVQERRAKFNTNNPDPTCMLCKEEVEDIGHMLLRCKVTAGCRAAKLEKLQRHGFNPKQSKQLLNGPSADAENYNFINMVITELCQKINSERSRLLQDMG
jgi:hypothetical protein